MDLTGKTAVITGAGGGIGGAITKALIEKGVNVCVMSRTTCADTAAPPAQRRDSSTVASYKGDLEKDADLRKFCAHIEEQMSAVDILVHCAGAYHAGTVEETPVEELDRLYRVNLRAPYLLTRAFLPMLKQAKGQIVFMNSSAASKGTANLSQYASSKSALRTLADSLRQEVNRYGIRVLSVFPGRTASKMQEEVHRLEGRTLDTRYLIQPQDIAEMVVKTLELPRSAEVTDIHIRPLRKAP